MYPALNFRNEKCAEDLKSFVFVSKIKIKTAANQQWVKEKKREYFKMHVLLAYRLFLRSNNFHGQN
jgi:hypothetical protein